MTPEARAVALEIIGATTELHRGFTVAAAHRLVRALERKHPNVQTRWTRDRPPCAIGTTIHTAPIEDEKTFAIWLHEFIHATSPPCPNTGRHRQTIRSGVSICVHCEELTNTRAMAIVPLSKQGVKPLEVGMESYLRGSHVATAPARAAARRVVNGSAWRVSVHRWSQYQIRMDKWRDIKNGWPY